MNESKLGNARVLSLRNPEDYKGRYGALKVNIQKLAKRLIPLLTVCVVLLSSLVAPVSAEEVNYRDYETSVQVDGDNDLVTVTFPTEWIHGLVAHTDGSGVKHWDGPVLDWEAYDTDFTQSSDVMRIYVAPFGTTLGAWETSYKGRYLSLKNIPTDSIFEIGFLFGGTTATNNIKWVSSDERAYSVTDGYASMYFKSVKTLNVTGSSLDPYKSEISTGSGEGFFPEYIFTIETANGQDFSSQHFYLEVEYFRMKISISSLYRLQEQSGITNELLTEVNEQLAEQNKNLEDIINGTPEMNDKVDSAVDDMNNAGNQLEDLGESLNAVEKPNTDNLDVGIDSFLPETSFLAYTAPIRNLWENDTLVGMLIIVLTLVLVSWVFFGKKG